MNQSCRIVLIALAALALGACGQSPSEPVVEAEPAAAPAEVVAGRDKLVSVDADGNIAPFGFAAKKPVPVAEPDTGAADTDAVMAASSEVYSVHCVACHGADARGVQGLGLNLVTSELVSGSSQDELIAFLKVGRAPDSPDSVSGVPMPGFAWLSDEQLGDVTGYLQSLQN